MKGKRRKKSSLLELIIPSRNIILCKDTKFHNNKPNYNTNFSLLTPFYVNKEQEKDYYEQKKQNNNKKNSKHPTPKIILIKKTKSRKNTFYCLSSQY